MFTTLHIVTDIRLCLDDGLRLSTCKPKPYIGCSYPCPPMPLFMGGHGWAYKVIDLGKKEIIATVSLALLVNRDTTAKFNILLWWKLKGASTFPIMLHVAHSVLCIPASNSKLESNFSDAGNTLTKKRSDPTKTW